MRGDLHERLVGASPPRGEAPIGAIRERARHRQRRRRALWVSSGAVAAVAVVVFAGSVLGRDIVVVGTSDGQVEVPDVTGLPVAEAKEALERVGLKGSVVSGYVEHDGERIAWSDPDGPDAVVVAQEPAAHARVAMGSVVGFRTATVNPSLCAVFREIPPRRGDALDLAGSEGFFDMLRRARPHAEGKLAEAIDQLVAHHDAGGSPVDAPPLTLDRVTIQHDACSRATEPTEEGAGSDAGAGPPQDDLAFCPGTRHSFEFPPPSFESGDGLPPSGSATHAAAERVAADRAVLAEYGAKQSLVTEVAGRAWRQSGSGDIEIVAERVFVVDLVLGNRGRCPHMPRFNEVPLRFLYPADS